MLLAELAARQAQEDERDTGDEIGDERDRDGFTEQVWCGRKPDRDVGEVRPRSTSANAAAMIWMRRMSIQPSGLRPSRRHRACGNDAPHAR